MTRPRRAFSILAALKPFLILAVVKLFSWPALFGMFRFVQKACLHAMNRTSAGFLPVTWTGERHALRRVLGGLAGKDRMVILDCGAGSGAYSDMALAECRRAHVVPVIHMFEPTSYCYDRLVAKYESQGGMLVVHKLAVSASSGRARIYFPWPGAGGASLSPETSRIQGTSAHGEMAEEVATVSIDDFCLRHAITTIHLLKLDIEGEELGALTGAKRTIEANAIHAIQFELGSAALPVRATLYEFWKLLADRFEFHLVLGNGLAALPEYKPDLECFFAGSNFLLLRKVDA